MKLHLKNQDDNGLTVKSLDHVLANLKLRTSATACQKDPVELDCNVQVIEEINYYSERIYSWQQLQTCPSCVCVCIASTR